MKNNNNSPIFLQNCLYQQKTDKKHANKFIYDLFSEEIGQTMAAGRSENMRN